MVRKEAGLFSFSMFDGTWLPERESARDEHNVNYQTGLIGKARTLNDSDPLTAPFNSRQTPRVVTRHCPQWKTQPSCYTRRGLFRSSPKCFYGNSQIEPLGRRWVWIKIGIHSANTIRKLSATFGSKFDSKSFELQAQLHNGSQEDSFSQKNLSEPYLRHLVTSAISVTNWNNIYRKFQIEIF